MGDLVEFLRARLDEDEQAAGVVELPGWRERAYGRKAARELRPEREVTTTHLHGTAVVCPCGVVVGSACVVFLDDPEAGRRDRCGGCGFGPDDLPG